VRKLGAQNLKGRLQKKRIGFALKFLTRHAHEGDEFLDSIMNGDETWGFHHTPESKQESLQWRHTQEEVMKCLNTRTV
jgi:hypothetical protein